MTTKTLTILFSFMLVMFFTVAPARQSLGLQTPAGMAPQPQTVAEIHVFKSQRKMELRDKYGNVIRQYRIALGKNPVGNKEFEGDNRTPEGRYIIDARNPNSEFYLSLRISYPSANDRKRAKKQGVKPGGNIFIHGLPNGKGWMWWKYNTKQDWTNGCIAVLDRDIKEMWELVADRTPIVISP